MDLIENQNIEIDSQENSSIRSEPVSVSSHTNQETSEKTVEKYLTSYIHALSCVDTKCTHEKCLQFKRAIQHSKTCLKYQQCKFCYQLIALSCYHSKQCNDKNCSVPFCISIKIKLNSILEMKKIKKFLIENSNYSKMYAQQLVEAQTQTDGLLKRKHSHDQLFSLTSSSSTTNTDNTSTNSEPELADFIAKLNAIKEKHQTSIQRPNKMLNKILPNQRKDLVNFVFELTLNKSLAQRKLCENNIDFKNKHLARYAFYLIMREQAINDGLRDAEDYFYLLAELAFKAKFEMEKFLTVKRENAQVQCDLNETIESTGECESFAIKKVKLE
jgi:hypothetical protein